MPHFTLDLFGAQRLIATLAWLILASCSAPATPSHTPAAPDKMTPAQVLPATPMRFDLPGGDSLVARVWSTPTPWHIVLGVHGFNDYSKAFEPLAQHLAGKLGATVYAYDQRGFGANPEPGVWPGSDALLAELRHIVVQLRQRHPGLPLTVMGAAPLAAAKCVTPTAKHAAGPGFGVRQTPVTYF